MTKNDEPAAGTASANLSTNSWEKTRAMCLGGAGACTAIILLVLQNSELRERSKLALFFACAGLPLLLASAFMVENYLEYGEASHKNPSSPAAFMLMGLVYVFGGLSLIASLFELVHQSFPGIGWFFLAVSALAFIATMWHYRASKPGG